MAQVTGKRFVRSLNIFVGQYVLKKYMYTLKKLYSTECTKNNIDNS